ncbi:ribosome silencing factor [Limnohabitans sp. 2KL-1]|jgi:ribosome-associated protein|uniref:ribosome silencing factor n=1 Tax=Limnohabitans sp. 2KL-1 TaxID=1100699 RepID=UPI000D3531E1|nr:ribosome silencing factor [Limnohabitans sp. 2KL-1]PUE47431.1 ribosome silencing factor [Limnohabitans sp. 2KL-1]
MTENAAKKDIQKLQRAIVDALEDVKAQEIQVFDTEHLSSLFERVIIASGTSNRQTKALAASVRDKVRNAGFGKPRMEGEDNGEWIIVDCGQAVVHVMQPTIRTYYNLEEIWGGTPVRLKFGAPKPAATAEVKGHIKNSVAKKATAKTTAAKTPVSKKAAAKPAAKAKPALKAPAQSAKPAAKPAVKAPVKTATKTTAKTTAKLAPKASSPSSKPTVKTVGKPTAKPAAKAATKTAAKKAPARKAVQAATRRKAD